MDSAKIKHRTQYHKYGTTFYIIGDVESASARYRHSSDMPSQIQMYTV